MKVAVVGVGHLGKHHARLYTDMPGTELIGVVDILPDRAAEAAQAHNTRSFTDYHELFGKVDAVSVAVPTTDHARVGAEFLENGIDVLVEKPIASTLSE